MHERTDGTGPSVNTFCIIFFSSFEMRTLAFQIVNNFVVEHGGGLRD